MTFELVGWRLRWMVPTLVLLAATAAAGMLAAARADARAKGARTEVIVQLRDGTSLSEGAPSAARSAASCASSTAWGLS